MESIYFYTKFLIRRNTEVLEMSDEQNHILWIRFKNGDDIALTMLYRKYANDLFSYGLKIVNNEILVKDCLQEVFIQLINKRKSIEVNSNTHIYLFKSLRNKLFEEIRSENRKQEILNNIPENKDRGNKTIEQLIIQTEETSKIRKELNLAIEKLSKRQKEIIFLKFTEGFDNTEIAELLQIERASVRKLLYRSLTSIKKSINKDNLILLYLFSLLKT